MAAPTTAAITALFDTPFYTGGGVSSDVPGLFPVALDGHPYILDLHPDIRSERFTRTSIQTLRAQADASNLPSEASLNPEDLWRRASENWNHGAGQKYFDRKDSDDARFRTSKGVDPWTKWQLTLLPEAIVKKTSASTNLSLVAAGARLYMADNQTTRYTTTTSTSDDFAAVTGSPAAAITGITSDGVNVWIAYGASGLYHTTTALTAATQRVTDSVTGPIGYVRGRLLVADGSVLYNLTGNSVATTGAATKATLAPVTSMTYTHPNTNFVWVGFAETLGNIYAAGYAGDKSVIYRTAVRSDGTSLDVPVAAGELPDGEIVRSIQGYLGFILVGTDRGVRFATVDGAGNLTFGALIVTGGPVYCFEPQDRFVWFGWPNFDSTSSGLGRLDLSTFTQPLTPAYASDMMITGQAVPQAVVTFLNKRVFVVSGLGVYVETVNKVSTGTLDSGYITYGIHDAKVPMYLEVRCLPLVGTFGVSLAGDQEVFSALSGTPTTGITSFQFSAGQNQSSRFETRVTLSRASGSDTVGPTVIRLVLRSYPATLSGEKWVVPLVISESIVVQDQTRRFNPVTEIDFLRQIQIDHRLVTFQDGSQVHQVFLDDYEWRPHHQTVDGTGWEGTMTVMLKSLGSG